MFARNLAPYLQGAGLLIALSFIGPANASDLVFDPIPVNVTSMKGSGAVSVSVSCFPMDGQGNPLNDAFTGGAEQLKHPRVGTLDASGNFSGSLATNFNYQNSADAAKAKKWRCILMCTNQGGQTKNCQIGDGSMFYHVKSGNLTVDGPLP